jgi:release factor glutamine methyltransferase
MSHYKPREDSFLILKHIKDYAKGNVLDMGTGSGILAIEAAKYADKVVGADINDQSLFLAEKNAKKAGLTNLKFKYSDLFSSINEVFDLIVFNPPYLPSDERIKDVALDGGKSGYEVIECFISKANDHLEKDGRILLLFSSLTSKEDVDRIIDGNLFDKKLIDKQKLFYEELFVYEIWKSGVLKSLQKIKNMKLHAKGKRGIVYSGYLGRKKVAVKVKNPRSKAIGRIEHEARMLKRVNELNIGPELIQHDDGFVMMGFVEGDRIVDFFEKRNKKDIASIIRNVFDQLHALEKAGINKEEMHHPVKHIIVTEDLKPVLIDFERAGFREKAHNVTQFCQFLSSEGVNSILESKGIAVDKKELHELARKYSVDNSIESVKKIKVLF